MIPQSAPTSTFLKPQSPHLHIDGETCPWCEQKIPSERLKEIRGKIAEREREQMLAITAQLEQQHALQLDELRKAKEAEVAKLKEDTAAEALRIRQAAIEAAEVLVRDKIADKDKAVADAQAKIAEAEGKLSKLLEQHEITLNERLHSQREILEKDKIAAVNAERAKNLETRMKFEEQLQDMQRRLQKKPADEHGEGAELELFELLKAAFPDDRIRRVEKGAMGADIVHDVIENGKVCGKIVYDRKNRSNWKTEYATKLRDDQIAEKADHAILSTNKFPGGEDQLCMREHVILACPARVRWLAELLRGHIILTHELRISNEARDEKTAELYAFINSERCRQLLDSIETFVKKLEEIDVAEQKAHSRVWRDRGELLKSVLKTNGVFCFELDRIIGTAADDELARQDLNHD
ncbi:MAG TPA: DUF2130 domain-containing protein [Methylocella sp.]|jgi:hypothetical protein|nr:DUF2130 domain-containing protein [Methylocella sp.]